MVKISDHTSTKSDQHSPQSQNMISRPQGPWCEMYFNHEGHSKIVLSLSGIHSPQRASDTSVWISNSHKLCERTVRDTKTFSISICRDFHSSWPYIFHNIPYFSPLCWPMEHKTEINTTAKSNFGLCRQLCEKTVREREKLYI